MESTTSWRINLTDKTSTVNSRDRTTYPPHSDSIKHPTTFMTEFIASTCVTAGILFTLLVVCVKFREIICQKNRHPVSHIPNRRIVFFPCCKSSTADDTGIEMDDVNDDFEGGATIVKTASCNSNSKTLFAVEVNSPSDTIQSKRSKDS